jgi:predicted HD superfamily hydrolase involved in NAD metabolism
MTRRFFLNYDETVVDQYLPFLKRLLTPSRIEHSLGVMRVMAELAPIYSLDRLQAMTAGLLHDAARDLSKEQQITLAMEAGIKFHYPCEKHPIYLHALVGAFLVAKELHIHDDLVLDAIASHSYVANGNNFNAPLSRCLRFADLLAPINEWLGMKKLRSRVYEGFADDAALLQCRWLIEHFQEQGIPAHPNLERQYEKLLANQVVTESFFDRW